MIGIIHHGCEHWEDRPIEIVFNLLSFLIEQLANPADTEAVIHKLGPQIFPKILVLLTGEFMRLLEKGFPKRGFPKAGIIDSFLAVIQIIIQTPHPDLKKLIKVGGGNRHEFQPIKKGPILVSGLIKNTIIELDPTQIPRDQITLID
jgi:hypothetical protein